MSIITSSSVRIAASATSEPQREGVAGARSIGKGFTHRLEGVNQVWAAQVDFYQAGMTASLDLEASTITSSNNPVAQVETATVVAAAGVTSNGTCNLVVTGASIEGSPLTVPVSLTTATHTSASLIATAMRAALSGIPAISEEYEIGGSAAAIALVDKKKRGNDSGLNIAIPSGLGITAAASSASTTAGVGGVVISGGGDGKDDEGGTFPSPNSIQLLLIENTGLGDVTVSGFALDGGWFAIPAGTFVLFSVGSAAGAYIDPSLSSFPLLIGSAISESSPWAVEVLVYATRD